MPPRTRAVRATKASKENVGLLVQTKVKNTGKGTKSVRKPLADKTNSASDENASPESSKKVNKKSAKPTGKAAPEVVDGERPRRNRRLPPRYLESQVLQNLSNSKESSTTPKKSPNKTPDKVAATIESTFKTPSNVSDNSLAANRPKRATRLPSKYDDNSSPSRFVPSQGHTSTPLVPKIQDKPEDAKRISGRLAKLATQNDSAEMSPVNSKDQPQKNTLKRAATQKSTLKPILVKGSPDKVTSTSLEPVVQDKQQGIKRTLTSKQKVSTKKNTENVPKQITRVSPRKSTPKKGTPQKVTKLSPQKTITPKKLKQRRISEAFYLTFTFENNVDTKKAGKDRARRLRKQVQYKEDTLSPKLKSPDKDRPEKKESRKVLQANSSFKVLEEKKSKSGDNQDIYEFTFDPSEEPPPQKKKRKKVTAKKPTKPKTRMYKNNYEKNIARALADLKNVVGKQKVDDETITKAPECIPSHNTAEASVPNPSAVLISTVAEIHPDPAQNTSTRSNANKNHASIRVEDIAADFDASIQHHDDINYSPVTSPHRIETEQEHCPRMSPESIRHDDPLNLRNDLSFFDDQPVANSSMNASSRNPTATPWRVEFENLPIKWQANTYVKPDMTPALECSYVNHFDDGKKKHVYTDLVAQSNDALPEIEPEAPRLKQTSIISFIKEVVERSGNKKKRGLSATPTKANSLFDANTPSKTPRKETSASDKSAEIGVDDRSQTLKRKIHDDHNPTPAKVPRTDNENTLFGFDDSENQENVSPVKIVNNNRLRSLRSRSGAVLKELNKQTGPMRAELPAAMKAKLAPSSDAVEKMYHQMKSAADAPVFDKQDNQTTDVAEMPVDFEGDDSQSVHLFEDVELVHHLKPTRKSYGKTKKVTFRNSSDNASDDDEPAPAGNQSSDEDDLGDLSFHLPEVARKRATRKKKKTKKQLLSKKEKAEVDAWAASFNSMCEDVEGFALVVE